jgi:hypothetical protein
MRTNSLKKRWSTVSLLLLTYCSIGLVGSQGLVLCLGQDGHVAVEAAPMGAYCGVVFDHLGADAQDHLAYESQTDDSRCGSCSDTALILDAVRVESNRDLIHQEVSPNLVVVPGLDHPALDAFSTEVRRVFPQDSVSVVPAFLRSTILLI